MQELAPQDLAFLREVARREDKRVNMKPHRGTVFLPLAETEHAEHMLEKLCGSEGLLISSGTDTDEVNRQLASFLALAAVSGEGDPQQAFTYGFCQKLLGTVAADYFYKRSSSSDFMPYMECLENLIRDSG